jgi:hypothetical protein
MKKVIVLCIIFIAIAVTEIMAQPGLPSAPSQAPIDGGLGLLAVAGGAYAWKKLKENKGT